MEGRREEGGGRAREGRREGGREKRERDTDRGENLPIL